MPSKKSEQRSTKARYDERAVIDFIRDIFYDFAEQTSAIRDLSDAFARLADSTVQANDVKDLFVSIKEHFAPMLLQFHKENEELMHKISKVKEMTGNMIAKAEAYTDMIKQMMELEQEKIENEQKFEIAKRRLYTKVIIAAISGGGALVVLIELLIGRL